MANILSRICGWLKPAWPCGRIALIAEPSVRELDDWLRENMPELWANIQAADNCSATYDLLYEVCGVDGWHGVYACDLVTDSAPIFLARLKEIKAHGPHQHIQ
ncbi:hypothetical protein [Delftia acidovorans]|uniref:Uncharacterized protein n=1 Tax=Delftia acidovorans TaxID=80866 RepID=A0AAJ2V9R5_DELAC|nr:hypothetical protein [Delftia acidovorans]MDX4957239.1 hypothetical protein [Delftia acidovorans]